MSTNDPKMSTADENTPSDDENMLSDDENMSAAEKTQRQIVRLQKQIKAEQKKREDAEARADAEKKQREDAESRADAEKKQREDAESRADAEKKQREHTEKLINKTTASVYLSLVDQYLFANLTVEQDQSKMSAPGSTDVGGRFYPRYFRPWDNFPAKHAAKFSELMEVLGDNAEFPSPLALKSLRENADPLVSDEQDLRPFLRSSVEHPAGLLVTRYLLTTKHPEFKAFTFRSNYYGLDLRGLGVGVTASQGSTSQPPKKKPTSPKKLIGVPDRWGLGLHHTEKEINAHLVVGEYKAAHNLPASKLTQVFSQPPRPDFFIVAAREDNGETTPATMEKGSVFVARTLCQAYHYIIASGLEYGYVASGEGLILLHVGEDDPDTLYYFWRVFSPPTVRDNDSNPEAAEAEAAAETGSEAETAAPRLPQDTAAALMASLAMMGLQSKRRPENWILTREVNLRRWPQPKKMDTEMVLLGPSLPPPGDGDGGSGASGSGARGSDTASGSGADGSSGANGGSGAGASSGASPGKRPRSPEADQSDEADEATQQTTTVTETGLLPFCTQACLLGLSRRLPLDNHCPNVHRHRAARAAQEQQGDASVDDSHPLNEEQLRAVLVEQAKTDKAVNMRSLERLGMFGRFGALVRITVTGFGYTFVGKGTMAYMDGILDHELAIYEQLLAQQGLLVPVCMGKIDLPREFFPGPRCMPLCELLLLSFAGPDLTYDGAMPLGVDIQAEMDRTGRELRSLGLCNEDIRINNCAWNDEVRRVMYFDFDQAHFEDSKAMSGSPESLDSLVKTEPATPCSDLMPPLKKQDEKNEKETSSGVLGKRDWGQFCDSFDTTGSKEV